MFWHSSLRRLRRTRVRIHTADEQSIEGVLVDSYPDCLCLSHAQLVLPDGAQPIEGSVLIPRANISWVQTR